MYFHLISAVAALGGLLFGYDTGVISGALLFIRRVMSLSPTLQGIVVAIALAGAAIGAAMAGYLSDRMGRRRGILTAGLLFIAGAIVSAVAQEVTILVIGRFLVGLAIGVASMLTPLYLAEISSASGRGAIVSLNQLWITVGILVSYLVGFALAGVSDGWRWMVALGALPGIILSLGMLVLPESPRWLAGHNRTHDAESVLQRLRGTANISDELAALRTDIAREGRRIASASELLSPRLRRPLIIGIGLAMFEQITGINTLIYFASNLRSCPPRRRPSWPPPGSARST
jgi:MFS transporter, SP family, galactose:H+ symporter